MRVGAEAGLGAVDLRRPFYRKTAVSGDFGRNEPEFPWERTNRIKNLRDDAGE